MGRRHLSLVLALTLTMPLLTSANAGEAKKETLYTYDDLNIAKIMIEINQELNLNQQRVAKVKATEVESSEETLKPSRPNIPGIPLDVKLLDYIWNKAQKHSLSYEMLLAIAKTESDFNSNTESSTHDSGLFQINKRTGKWIAEELGLTEYDLSNPYTSTDFAVYYLTTLRDAWDNKGLSEEELFDVVIISYNRGVGGANKYIKKYGTENNTYLNQVSKYKELYEMGE